MAILAYARTSTDDKQILDSQLDALNRYGYDRIFLDQSSGKDKRRPGYEAMMEYARSGDEIVVYSLSRLTRSTKDAIEIADELEEREIDLISLTESISTGTPAGRMFFTVLAALGQMQREQTVENTKAGLAAARARGRSGGRPRKDEKAVKQAIALYDAKAASAKGIAEITGVSPSTLYRRLRERAENKEKESDHAAK